MQTDYLRSWTPVALVAVWLVYDSARRRFERYEVSGAGGELVRAASGLSVVFVLLFVLLAALIIGALFWGGVRTVPTGQAPPIYEIK